MPAEGRRWAGRPPQTRQGRWGALRFSLIDPEWEPAFLKVCGYAPYAIKLCLNGHEWVKRHRP